MQVEGDVLATHVGKWARKRAGRLDDEGHEVARRAGTFDDMSKSDLAGELRRPGPDGDDRQLARNLERGTFGKSPQSVAAGDDYCGHAVEGSCGDRQLLDPQQRLDRHLMAE